MGFRVSHKEDAVRSSAFQAVKCGQRASDANFRTTSPLPPLRRLKPELPTSARPEAMHGEPVVSSVHSSTESHNAYWKSVSLFSPTRPRLPRREQGCNLRS